MSRSLKLALGAAVGAVVLVNVAIAVSDSLWGGRPGGPSSSAFATGSDGVAALAELLRRAGHDVERLRVEPSEASLDRTGTLFLLDAFGVTAVEATRLRRFVQGGGHIVVGGSGGRWLPAIAPDAPEWVPSGPSVSRPLAPASENAAVERVVGEGDASRRLQGPALPVLGTRSGAVVSVLRVGAGRLVLLADVSPLTNEWLDRADNARLGLDLAGGSSRRVWFAETFHGYGRGSGVGAVPDDWLAALVLGVVAVLVLMVARGRRLGPAEPDERPLPPARAEYVEALGALLARTGDRVAAARVLAVRAGRDPEARDVDLLTLGREAARIERSRERRGR